MTTEEKFNELASKWRKETGGYSTTYHIIKNKNYKEIIEMGVAVVPFIFKTLQKEPDQWFEALDQILKPDPNPIKKGHYGNYKKMAEDWLEWAKEKELIESIPDDYLYFEDLIEGEKFICFPINGDNSGHGGYKGVHYIFEKINDNSAIRVSDKIESSFPLKFAIIKVG